VTVPVRIQLSRAKGWRMPENTVRVTRPGPWGNPYAVWREPWEHSWLVSRDSEHHVAPSKADAQRLAVDLFRALVTDTRAASRRGAYAHPTDIMKGLRGKNLACWCALDAPCHADVLLELANAPVCEAVAP